MWLFIPHPVVALIEWSFHVFAIVWSARSKGLSTQLSILLLSDQVFEDWYAVPLD